MTSYYAVSCQLEEQREALGRGNVSVCVCVWSEVLDLDRSTGLRVQCFICSGGLLDME